MRDPTLMRGKVYRYDAGTHAHPRSLFRHSHGRRFLAAARLLEARPEHRVLDYGTGDGFLLRVLVGEVSAGARRPRLAPMPAEQLTGLEPMPFLRDQFREHLGSLPVTLVDRSEDLPAAAFDRIACLEVLEHLRPAALDHALDELDRLLAPDGVLVVSVPLEIGLSVLAKYAAALALTRMDRWYTWRDLVCALFGRRVEREAEGEFISSHKGFDYRTTRAALRRRWRIEREWFTPYRWLGPALNSQVTWRLRR